MDYGKALREIREEYELSQSELARRTGISQGTISYWESNTYIPTINSCIQLADFYGISLDELIGRTVPIGQVINPNKKK